MKKQLTLGILLCLSSFIYAQKTPGYIVKINGDTVNGTINYRNWRENPKDIQFYTTSTTQTTYTPKDILSFGVKLKNETEVYKAAKVGLDISSDNIDRLDIEKEFKEREDYLFLRKIYNGSYTLYLYQDQKEHFFIGKGNEITELKNKIYLLPNQSFIFKNEQYKTQLVSLLKNCAQISSNDINNVAYNHNQLVKILKTYDSCIGLQTDGRVEADKAKIVYGILLGTDYSQFKIKSQSTLEPSLNSAGNFATGLSFGIILPRNNKRSSIILELLYRHYKFDGKYDIITDADKYSKHSYKFSGNYLRLNLMYRYQWTTTKLKPFINIGGGHGFKLTTIDKSTAETKFYSTITNGNDPVIKEERRFEQALNIGAGINIKKVNIELRAETTNGFSSYVNTKSSVNSLYLNLNYIFN